MTDICKDLSELAGQKAMEIMNSKTALTSEDISAVKILADICFTYNFNIRLGSRYK